MSETTTNLIENLNNLSRTWASAALASTSESLKATADFIGSLGAKLGPDKVEEAAATPKSDDEKN